ncbi:MAG: molecular chaperone TorD family protein [Nitrospirae bacterium]|nr:molecular chaperone TorD family protein [Nitrospirota bacterium]
MCKPTKEALENWKILLSEGIPDFMSDLKDAIDEIDITSEQELDDLLWEYTRLFIGPYKLPCPPWESVYTSPKKLMMQNAYDEVLDFYVKSGLTVNNPDIMPDHIGAELNFLAVLLQRINDDPEKRSHCLDTANRFLNTHVITWIPKFTRDMEDAADSSLYKELAKVTRHILLDTINPQFQVY